MQYSLICSDFDGTLLRSDGKVGERTVKAIAAFQERGGVFAVCTGRMLPAILPEVKKLGLTGLVASFNGSLISDIESGKILRFDGFAPKEAASLLRELEKENLRLHAYSADTLFVNYRDEFLSLYEKACHVTGQQKPCLSAFIAGVEFIVPKIVIVIEPEREEELFSRVTEKFGGEYYVTTSSTFLIEISPKGHDKGSAIRFLSEYYSIPIEKSLALGDQFNDLPMLEAAGKGVAVGNAAEELKRKADLVTVSNDEDAVGVIIEQFSNEQDKGEENGGN